MVQVKKINKKVPRNWVDGDTFAIKIENTKTMYDGQYLILIRRETPELNFLGNWPRFSAKITKNCQLPSTKKEIDSLEYIISDINLWCRRFNPTSGIETYADVRKRKKDIKFYPDECMYLHSYVFDFYIRRGAPLEVFEYIGNFQIELPKDEYIPPGVRSLDISKEKPKEFISDIIKYYEDYNKRKNVSYTEEGLEKSEILNKTEQQLIIALNDYFDTYKKTGVLPIIKDYEKETAKVTAFIDNHYALKDKIYEELGITNKSEKLRLNRAMLINEDKYLLNLSKKGKWPTEKEIYKDITKIINMDKR